MSTIRFFNGGRDSGKRSIATEIMRIEVQKNGKMPSADRFKYIFKERLKESRKKVLGIKPVGFSLSTTIKQPRQLSKTAEKALVDVAKRKAAKEAKAMRKMVLITPRIFSNGSIVKNGKIFDIAGNTVARVNTKNGKMVLSAGMGGTLGQYKPKSQRTHSIIEGAIDKYSPYYINLRKMQAMQQGSSGDYGVWGNPHGDTVNIHGRAAGGHSHSAGADQSSSGVYGDYSSDMAGPRQNVGATAWGAMSDNTWGTFSDNVWGTSTDTVWGSNTSDVWGGIGGNPWGNFAKTRHIWGTGNGHNYLKGLGARVAAFFGLHLKSQASRAAFHEAVNSYRSSRLSAHESTRAGAHEQATRAGSDHHSSAAATTRASAPAPTTRR